MPPLKLSVRYDFGALSEREREHRPRLTHCEKIVPQKDPTELGVPSDPTRGSEASSAPSVDEPDHGKLASRSNDQIYDSRQ